MKTIDFTNYGKKESIDLDGVEYWFVQKGNDRVFVKKDRLSKIDLAKIKIEPGEKKA